MEDKGKKIQKREKKKTLNTPSTDIYFSQLPQTHQAGWELIVIQGTKSYGLITAYPIIGTKLSTPISSSPYHQEDFLPPS
uniref:Uncharacterized protein n=1 Tax=Rhizophora mucronata TaxID=61149 RepID=A0A2P2LFJ5_RHIMU